MSVHSVSSKQILVAIDTCGIHIVDVGDEYYFSQGNIVHKSIIKGAAETPVLCALSDKFLNLI